jgi:hypothetical protein
MGAVLLARTVADARDDEDCNQLQPNLQPESLKMILQVAYGQQIRWS